MVSPNGETWRGRREGRRESERWTGWFRGVAGEARGRATPGLPTFCSRVRSSRSERGPMTAEFVALIGLFHVFPPPFCCRLSLSALSTLLYSISCTGTSQLSLCRLSRWPSLRSALECCFYTAASGGMWSLFWTAQQTDGGFHAAFMRLRATFP